MLHAAGAQLIQQRPGAGQQCAHTGAGLALQDSGGQLELAGSQDIGLLLHLHQALSQEQLQLWGKGRCGEGGRGGKRGQPETQPVLELPQSCCCSPP